MRCGHGHFTCMVSFLKRFLNTLDYFNIWRNNKNCIYYSFKYLQNKIVTKIKRSTCKVWVWDKHFPKAGFIFFASNKTWRNNMDQMRLCTADEQRKATALWPFPTCHWPKWRKELNLKSHEEHLNKALQYPSTNKEMNPFEKITLQCGRKKYGSRKIQSNSPVSNLWCTYLIPP